MDLCRAPFGGTPPCMGYLCLSRMGLWFGRCCLVCVVESYQVFAAFSDQFWRQQAWTQPFAMPPKRQDELERRLGMMRSQLPAECTVVLNRVVVLMRLVRLMMQPNGRASTQMAANARTLHEEVLETMTEIAGFGQTILRVLDTIVEQDNLRAAAQRRAGLRRRALGGLPPAAEDGPGGQPPAQGGPPFAPGGPPLALGGPSPAPGGPAEKKRKTH